MIDLTEPVDFTVAMEKFDAKEIFATPLSSAELADQMDAELLDKSFFSARVTNPVLLQAFKDSVNEILAGKTTEAVQVTKLKKLAESFGEKELATNHRLNLILDMGTQMSQGYGQYQENNYSADTFPANELFRLGRRKVPRHWLEIWDNARLLLGDLTTALPSSQGLIALKGDPIWTEISDFGLPWPPFKWNSGMWIRNVDFDACLEFGLIKENQPIPKPKTLPMNKGLSASVAGVEPDLLNALLQTFAGLSLVGTEVMLSEDDSTQNRSVSEVWEEIAA